MHWAGLPAPAWREQLLAVGLAVVTLAATSWVSLRWPAVQVVPALGASAVLVAALPTSPMARLWPLMVGTLASGGLAWGVAGQGWPLFVGLPLAVGGALLVMFALRCLHPPGGAMAVWVVLNPHGFASWGDLFLGILPGLLLLATLDRWRQRSMARAARAPVGHGTRDRPPLERQLPAAEDWNAALRQHGPLLDVSSDQLAQLYRELTLTRWRHRLGPQCVADIMSRDLISLPPQAPVASAWKLLQKHRIKMLPVQSQGRLLGVVSLVDILKRMGLDGAAPSAESLRQAAEWLQRPVSEIMNPPRAVPANLPLSELVPLLTDWGLHHVPVLDADGGMSGIVTQSDLIAALAEELGQGEARPGPGRMT